MSSIDRLARFITHSELKILDWVQAGKAHNVARCEKISSQEVCTRCAQCTVSIITVPPSEQMKQYHDRMPMYVPQSRYTEWVSGKNLEIASFLKPQVEYKVELVN